MLNNPIEEIKNRLDIVDVIQEYIKLKKAGANYQAICPFHSEKKPSFFVSPSRQIWKCFGCGKGGDIFGFVKEIEGVEFVDALRILAKKAGVELKQVRPELKSKQEKLFEICEIATEFFEKQIKESKTGEMVRAYLNARTISDGSIKEWRIGYSPDTWQGLSDFLQSRRYTKQEIVGTGLSVKDDKGHFYDRFRGRIMFPICDFQNQVIGFSGRIFEKPRSEKKYPGGKYVNTPNTLLYNKSNVLYGLDKARIDIRKEDSCILAEGQTDIILSRQVGIKNIVATSGTALTHYQLNILKRYTNNLVLSFDMDIAGDTATKRGIELAQSQGFNISVLVMPGSHDAADLIAKNPDDWKKVVKNKQEITDFYFESALTRFDKNTPEGKAKIAEVLLPVIKRIPNKIVSYHWIQKLSKELSVREKDIEQEMKKVKIEIKNEGYNKEKTKQEQKTQAEVLEREILLLGIEDPENVKNLSKQDLKLFSPKTTEIFLLIQKLGLDYEVLKKNVSVEIFESIQLLLLEIEVRGETENVRREFDWCLRRIKEINLRKELENISQKMKIAETEGDIKRSEKLAKEFNKKSKQFNQ